ncbi:MAG: BolA family transcriptional regulator [Proteobacteria bacterium]|nr:BolA family transcriptional regulator [Pseudomonadota bacterium]
MGAIETSITNKLNEALSPDHLEVINESDQHKGPPGRESHFRVLVVADIFDGQRLVGRHRMVNKTLKAELDAGLHALAIEALTPAQWEERNGVRMESPACGG